MAASAWPLTYALGTSGGAAMSELAFLSLWLCILCITSALNFILLAKEAARRGQALVSPGMRLALKAFAPPMLVGGCVGIGLILWLHNFTLAALMWILCYGLALLGTASFSPRSLIRLGWAFVITGLVLFFTWAVNRDVDMLPSDQAPASVALGLTFGLLHVIYALAVIFGTKHPEVETE